LGQITWESHDFLPPAQLVDDFKAQAGMRFQVHLFNGKFFAGE
jgi:hypothetical protein